MSSFLRNHSEYEDMFIFCWKNLEKENVTSGLEVKVLQSEYN